MGLGSGNARHREVAQTPKYPGFLPSWGFYQCQATSSCMSKNICIRTYITCLSPTSNTHTHTHTHTHTRSLVQGQKPSTWSELDLVSCVLPTASPYLRREAAQSAWFQPVLSSLPSLPCRSLTFPPPHSVSSPAIHHSSVSMPSVTVSLGSTTFAF